MSPIYILHCLDCGKVSEEFFPTIDVTKHICSCGSDKKEKLKTSANFRLHNEKCGGFTNTNSKTPSAG